MTPGQFVRSLLGPAFPIAGAAYRRVFVDMKRVVDAMLPYIPPGAHVLDVGGGDGYVIDLLLDRRPDARVVMTDIAPAIGSFVSPRNRERVTLMPGTDVAEVTGRFDVITLADVVHHVPVEARSAFFSSVADAARRTGCKTVIIKDIRPGGPRATLSLWADHYITGDKGVRLIGEDAVALPGFHRNDCLMPDHPNYLLVFARD